MVKGSIVKGFMTFSLEIILPDDKKYILIGILPATAQKSCSYVIAIINEAFELIEGLGEYQKFRLYCDGSKTENRNKHFFLWLLQKRMQKQFEEIVIQIGCPHHMNFSPDRFHSHCFMWFDRFARLNNINIQKYTELVKMGNELIAGKVTEESNSFNFIKFYDLEELKTKMPETTYEARFQWTETVGSTFPPFIPYENAVTPGNTIFYMHKFYEASMHRDEPHMFKFKILPGDSKFFMNEVSLID